MPWREVSVMEQRREFVRLAMMEGANRRELMRRFGISPVTGYKWLERWAEGESDLADRSRRPHHSPRRSDPALEADLIALREKHPAWGARKLVRCLERDGLTPPARSTVHEMLRRGGCIRPSANTGKSYERFEKPAPNLLWQMDFKGAVPLADKSRCHTLTVMITRATCPASKPASTNRRSPCKSI